ncbi:MULTISPECIES: site-specific integrase [Enterobacteriaceae]|uniref:site-specific integrase n=1 Tax=Enterobacteriaceae TaxID=543 RepID=UPI0004E3CDDB|nr:MULTISPECIES: site-specific integrase [Enterobacteriaceae]EEZ5718006.1 site-specific integrase [Escherichia coli O25]KFC89427.1 transposase [Leclercia adecarboxylata ATCC 23216 = NBRC 102595]QLS75282.1 site-specific integrase [Enterobacter roggenkampii]HBD5582289.1 site-specific integrase [Escherichia coli]HCR1979972.1 site-specific integrase [Enterobacter hormaechei subsp. steigerwaltii]
MTDINHDNTVYPSSSFSGSPYLYGQVYTPSPDTRLTQINLLGVAKPQLVRRANGRYTIRFRLKGQTTPFLSVSTRSTDRRVATMRQRELAATAKAFMLDRPEVSLQELTEHLRSMAEQFLTDASDDYWNGLEVATLVDEKSNLKELAATQALSLDQQKGIRLALEVLTAAQQRVDTGDTSGLIKLIDDNNHTDYSTIGDSTSILKNEQGDRPVVFTQERQPEVTICSFSELVSSLLAEKVQTLKSSSYKDLSSSLNTVSRFLPEDMDLMSRSEWLAVRDAMLASEVRPSTINKLLTKAKMCLDYGLMNGQLEGRNPIERMKLTKDVDSKRRAFTDEELERLLVRVEAEYQFTRHTAHTTSEARRWATLVSVVTGARSAEVCHLIKRDIVTIDKMVCIDINEDGDGKSVKNKHSVRLVPLTDGAYGFDLTSFLSWVDAQPDDGPLFGMTPSAYSSWFNSRVLTEALPDADNVSLHSLRHWLATRMKERGVNLVDAQGILGHSSQSITYDLYGKGHAVGRLADALNLALVGM